MLLVVADYGFKGRQYNAYDLLSVVDPQFIGAEGVSLSMLCKYSINTTVV